MAPPNHDYAHFYSDEYVFPTALRDMQEVEAFKELSPLMQKLAAGAVVTILVFGGSFTRGDGCCEKVPSSKLSFASGSLRFANGTLRSGAKQKTSDKDEDHFLIAGCQPNRSLTWKDCAWPARFAHWLRVVAPNSTVRLKNVANGGMPTRSWLAGIEATLKDNDLGEADLVIVDTLTNDLERGSFKAPDDPTLSAYDLMSMVFEQFLRTILELLPGTKLMVLLDQCPDCGKGSKHQRVVAEHYRIPVVDFVDLSKRVTAKSLWECCAVDREARGKGGNHPGWPTHQMVADTLSLLMAKSWGALCHGKPAASTSGLAPGRPYWPEERLLRFSVCSHGVSYTAGRPSPRGYPEPAVMEGNWTLYEDRPGKPGWISHVPRSKIRFKVRFRSRPRLVITWLRSYEGMGQARVSLKDASFVIDGLWQSHTSQAHSIWLTLGARGFEEGARKQGPEWRGGEQLLDLDIELLDAGGGQGKQKFKIIQVISC